MVSRASFSELVISTAGDVGAMLGLAQKIGGADLARRRVVGDDEGFGRTREQIDADAPEQLPLGLGYVGIAGPDDHIDRLDRLASERHRGHRLNAAEARKSHRPRQGASRRQWPDAARP